MQEKFQPCLFLKDKWAQTNPATKKAIYGVIAIIPTIAFALAASTLNEDANTLGTIPMSWYHVFSAIDLYYDMQALKVGSIIGSGLSGIASLGFFGSSVYHCCKQPSFQSDLNESSRLTTNLPV